MPLINFQRITFSLPKATVLKLELNVPKNKRSKFVASLIEKDLNDQLKEEETHKFWSEMAKHYKPKTKKTAVELVREDRLSH